jgi:radical SAM PhpK family P-methyltransferase
MDCLIIGYNDADFEDYAMMCRRAGTDSPEFQIFRKEHLTLDGQAMPWIEAFSHMRNSVTGRNDRYHPAEVFNLAALYLTSYLRRHGFSAEAVTLFSAQRKEIADLLDRGPAVVAITTTFYVTILPVLPVIKFIREVSPQSHIVVGGPLVGNLCQDGMGPGFQPNQLLQDLLTLIGADSYVWESQGEWTLLQLCQALRTKVELDRVPNMLIPVNRTWVTTRRSPESNNLDECAIDWSTFPAADLAPTAQMRTARSCAFKCSFCDYPQRAGALTTASVETVRRELRQLAEQGVTNVVFIDDTFNVPPKRFKELCRMMIEEDTGISWYSYFRCSHARDEETFDLAAASGCAGVFLGIESADSNVLSNMSKLANSDQYKLGIERFNERGITSFASIILGFPGETEESVQRTIEFLNETEPTFWRVQAWWANPKSPIFASREVHLIEGESYTWRHRSMNSQQAAALCDYMFDAVTASTWLPLYDFDFWSLPYLAGKHVSHEQVRLMLDPVQRLMRERDKANPDQRQLAMLYDEMRSAVRATTPAPARFDFDSAK